MFLFTTCQFPMQKKYFRVSWPEGGFPLIIKPGFEKTACLMGGGSKNLYRQDLVPCSWLYQCRDLFCSWSSSCQTRPYRRHRSWAYQFFRSCQTVQNWKNHVNPSLPISNTCCPKIQLLGSMISVASEQSEVVYAEKKKPDAWPWALCPSGAS